MSLPGGVLHETRHWRVEHCVGPLEIGALIVKPKRHVVRVSELEPEEAAELGGTLRAAAGAVDALIRPEQVYVTLWSHAGGVPVHIHWVIQPVTRALLDSFGLRGPHLQVAMFDRNETPAEAEVEAIAVEFREWFASNAVAGSREP